MIEWLKKSWIILATGIGVGFILTLLFVNIPIVFAITIVALLFLMELLLGKMEQDSATKRMIKRLLIFGVAVVIFTGIRVWAGVFFDMPIIKAVDAVNKGWWKITAPYFPDSSLELALEFMFFFVAALISWGVVIGITSKGKVAGLGKLLIFLLFSFLFVSMLWQAKQVKHAQAVKGRAQSEFNLDTTRQTIKAVQNNAKAEMIKSVVVESIDKDLPKDTKLIHHSLKFIEVAGISEQMVEGFVEKDGLFQKTVIVPFRKIRVLPADYEGWPSPPPPPKPAPYSETLTLSTKGKEVPSNKSFKKNQWVQISIEGGPVTRMHSPTFGEDIVAPWTYKSQCWGDAEIVFKAKTNQPAHVTITEIDG
jgi:hypothetical protein